MAKDTSEMIGLRLSKELKDAATAVASAEDRSLSAVFRQALIAYLADRGRLPRANQENA